MKKVLLPVCVSLGLLAACDETTPPAQQGADLTEIGAVRYVDWHDNYYVQAIQYAGHNAGHYIGVYEPSTFVAKTAQDAMRKKDKDRGCPGRIWSKSKKNAIDTFDLLLEQEDPFQNAAEEGGSPEWHTLKTKEIMADPTNLGVFSSRFDPDGADAPESCLYWNFYVYRADGTAILLQFDYTD